MKAKIKENGKWITVDTCNEGFYDVETHEIYEPDELEFDSGFDWSALRGEAAKDILCAMVANNYLGYYGNDYAALAKSSIFLADELIKQLKEK